MDLLEIVNAILREGEGHLGNELITALPLDSSSPDSHFFALAMAQASYEDIQRRHANYKFHWQTGLFITTNSDDTDYAVSNVRNVETDSFIIQKSGSSSWTPMHWIDWPDWQRAFRSTWTQIGASWPYWMTRLPNDSFRILPKPISTETYLINAEWYRTNHQLSDSEDIPLWDEEFHRLIVLEALMRYAEENNVSELGYRIGVELPQLQQAFYNRYLP